MAYVLLNSDKPGYLLKSFDTLKADLVFSVIIYLILVVISDMLFRFLLLALVPAYLGLKLLVTDLDLVLMASKSVPALTFIVFITLITIGLLVAYFLVSGISSGVEGFLKNNLGLDYVFFAVMFILFTIAEFLLDGVFRDKKTK
jgi:hypothetical protein